jgi:23S rRNA (adenine2503-C2)-methyltransferase
MLQSAVATMEKPNLYGLGLEALAAHLSRHEVPAFHAGQIYRWLYGRRQLQPEAWTDLPGALRQRLAADSRVARGSLATRAGAADGTVKYRVVLAEGGAVECVSMVQRDRITFCLSSQVGCALACDFCLTGKMGLVRHLTAGEIVGQVSLLQDEPQLAGRPFNIVFMGMGEPLHNYAGVLAAIRLLVDPAGFAVPQRRITVSTSGLAPAILKLAREPVRPRLAVSLNATTDAVRDRLMPINRRYPLARLLEACLAYQHAQDRRFTFEYVLLAGVNESEADVERLASIVRRFDAKLNLIPFNPVPGWLDYAPPTRRRVLEIRDRLLARGLAVSIRWSRGAQARAACGQLALLER